MIIIELTLMIILTHCLSGNLVPWTSFRTVVDIVYGWSLVKFLDVHLQCMMKLFCWIILNLWTRFELCVHLRWLKCFISIISNLKGSWITRKYRLTSEYGTYLVWFCIQPSFGLTLMALKTLSGPTFERICNPAFYYVGTFLVSLKIWWSLFLFWFYWNHCRDGFT